LPPLCALYAHTNFLVNLAGLTAFPALAVGPESYSIFSAWFARRRPIKLRNMDFHLDAPISATRRANGGMLRADRTANFLSLLSARSEARIACYPANERSLMVLK
jgi:hypothetical protein